jgi:hypothetical protein
MGVRFPLRRSVESGTRDLSFAESCALGLRSQLPVSSVCRQGWLGTGQCLTRRQIANSPAANSAGVIGRIRHPARLAAKAWAMHLGEATIA